MDIILSIFKIEMPAKKQPGKYEDICTGGKEKKIGTV